MKLPCPIQALVGSDGVYVTVVAKSHVNPGAVFSETWSAVDETRRTQVEETFVKWFRARLPIEESADPVIATLIVPDSSRFLHTTGWNQIYSRDRMAVLDSRSMMFVLGNIGIFGENSRHAWYEAVVPSSDPEVLQGKLDEQIQATESIMFVCGSLREVISAASEIKRLVGSDLVAVK